MLKDDVHKLYIQEKIASILMLARKILIGGFLSLLTFNQTLAGDCGSKEGYYQRLADKFVIPDQFPPKFSDATILQALVAPSHINLCVNYGHAGLDVGCRAHDKCYDTHGANKHECDKKLLQDWEASCNTQYRKMYRIFGSDLEFPYPDNPIRTSCQLACIGFVNLMSEAQTSNEFGECLSCKAFDAAQEKHRPVTSSPPSNPVTQSSPQDPLIPIYYRLLN